MQTSFHSKLTYQDLHEYDVWGAPEFIRIEVYRTPHPSTLQYMRETFNHCGDPTAFDRMVLARQNAPTGGAVVRTRDESLRDKTRRDRWTPELYRAFCEHLEAKHAEYIAHHQKQVEKYGADYPALEPMKPHPAPLYWDHDAGRYQVEAFYPEIIKTRRLSSELAATLGGA